MFLLLLILLSSCATILNTKRTTVKISANQQSKVVFKSDTILANTLQTSIRPIHSKKPIKLTILKDSLKNNFYFSRKLLCNFLLNTVLKKRAMYMLETM
ncbi:hypothetical protein [uncultured Polaribacter sp.]|uniref:hypothetical protein n=1 Tax=uncultured Polaribacter sp. TaxID=174711 RepID=UPI002633FD3C|nr:hypothetical protein [uncultured Polaribacter sp.]